MKKIFTLLMALAMVLSLSAANRGQHARKHASNLKRQNKEMVMKAAPAQKAAAATKTITFSETPYCDAILWQYDEDWFIWDLNIYIEDTDFPYLLIEMDANCANKLCGTYTDEIEWASVCTSANDTAKIGDDYDAQVTIAMSGAYYTISGYFVDEAGNTWNFNTKVDMWAYDDDNEVELTLDESAACVAPGESQDDPTGEYTSVAEAIAVGKGLAAGASTTTEYTVLGYVAKLVGTYNTSTGAQSFYLSDTANADPGAYYTFEAYQCTGKEAVKLGDMVLVTGNIMNYVSKSGNQTIEISQGTFTKFEKATVVVEADEFVPEYYNSGDWQDLLALYDADGEPIYEIYIDYYSSNSELPIGTFAASDFDYEYTFVKDYTTGEELEVTSATATITMSADSVFEVNATVETALKTFKVHYKGTASEVNYYEWDEPADATLAFAGEEAEFDTKYFEEYGDVDLYLSNDTAGADFYFYVTNIDPVTYIPVGTYTINNTYDEWTIEASAGLGTYGPTPAVAYTTVEEDGELYYDKVWYMVSGTAVVAYANDVLTITVNAKNSLGNDVKVTYTSASKPTGISNADKKVKATKMLNRDQIVIRSGERHYNVQGKTLK